MLNWPHSARRGAAGAALLLAVALALGGCSPSLPALLEKARAAQAKGDPAASAIHLANALAIDPRNVEALLLLGRALSEAGEFADAEKALSRAASLGATPPQYLATKATALLELEKFRQVLEEIQAEDAGGDAALRAEIAVARGRAHLRLGALEEARAQFLLALPNRPDDARIGLAHVAAAEGQEQEAHRVLAENLAAATPRADSWVAQADLLRGAGKTDEALAAFRRAFKADSRHVAARLGASFILVARGRFEEARKELEPIRRVAPGHPGLNFALAYLHLREGRYGACREALERVSRQIPEHMPSLLLSGILLDATGHHEQAHSAFRAYLSRNPGQIYARKMLAVTLLKLAQPKSAATVLAPLLAMPLQDTEIFALAGQAYIQLGQVALAQKYLEQAVKAAPENPGVRSRLGVTRLAAGDRQGALADLEASLVLNPADAKTENYLVIALLGAREHERALKAADAMIAKRAKDPISHLIYGAVRLARKEVPQARASFEEALRLRASYFPAAAALANLDARNGDQQAAIGRMQAVLKHDPKNLDAMLMLATLELQAQRREAAVATLRRAQIEHPQAAEPYMMIAEIQLRGGDAAEAISIARQARELNPRDAKAVELLARSQMAAGDATGAISGYTTLAEMRPTSVDARIGLAEAYSGAGNHREAIATLLKALEVDKKGARVRTALAMAYLLAKRYPEALESAQALQRANVAAGHAIEGDVHFAREEFSRAAAAYRRADALEPSGLMRVRAHAAEAKAAKGSASEAPLREWLARHPSDLDVRLYLADLHAAAGRHDAAVQEYLALLKTAPGDFRVLNNLAWTLNELKDARATQYAQQAFRIAPNNPVVLDTLGWILASQGKVQEGLGMLVKAVTLAPENPGMRFRLAQAFVQSGDLGRARTELKYLVEKGGRFPQADQAQALLRKISG